MNSSAMLATIGAERAPAEALRWFCIVLDASRRRNLANPVRRAA
jgi:hypothetical protein